MVSEIPSKETDTFKNNESIDKEQHEYHFGKYIFKSVIQAKIKNFSLINILHLSCFLHINNHYFFYTRD